MTVRTLRAALAAVAVAGLAMIGGQTAAAAGTPLTGVMLTGTAATIGTCEGRFAPYTFTSSGTATGAYAGTYIETGSFVIDQNEELLPSFTADFTITGAGGTVVTGHLSNVFSGTNDTFHFCRRNVPNIGVIQATVQYSASIAFADGTTCTDAGTSHVLVNGGNSFLGASPVTVETFNSTGPFTCGNTPVSTGPKTLTFGSVTITFDSVSALGNTTVTTSPTGPPIPAGFILLGGSYYEVSTTAVFTSATVCITDPSVATSSRLLHYPVPTDVTLLPVVPPQICSTSLTSFSPFAIVQPAKERHKRKKGHDRDRDDDDDDDDHDDDKKHRGQFPFGPKKGK